jgi:hypothetical protein
MAPESLGATSRRLCGLCSMYCARGDGPCKKPGPHSLPADDVCEANATSCLKAMAYEFTFMQFEGSMSKTSLNKELL